MHLNQPTVPTVYSMADRPVHTSRLSAIQVQGELQKWFSSMWSSQVNCGPSEGGLQTVRRRKFLGRIFLQNLCSGGHDL